MPANERRITGASSLLSKEPKQSIVINDIRKIAKQMLAITVNIIAGILNLFMHPY